MKWDVQYREKGSSIILVETVDVELTTKRDVQKWWKSKSLTPVKVRNHRNLITHREDREFVNCLPWKDI